jgi:hypothetical protein
MAGKGMSQTLVIIVAAVVVLVTALILLTIFGTGMAPISTLSEARNSCRLQGESICKSTGQLPPTWDLQTIKVGGELLSCNQICSPNKPLTESDCVPLGGIAPNSYQLIC